MVDLVREFAWLSRAVGAGGFENAIRNSSLAAAEVRRHPLNFLAARVEDGSGFAIRLHLWDRRFRFGQIGFEVHDHAFDLESVVVAGAVAQRTFERVPDVNSELVAFQVSYAEGGSTLMSRGNPVSLQETGCENYSAGETYRLRHGVLHRLDLIGEAAITLVLTQDRGGPPTTIGPAIGATMATPRAVVRGADGQPARLSSCSIAEIIELALARDS